MSNFFSIKLSAKNFCKFFTVEFIAEKIFFKFFYCWIHCKKTIRKFVFCWQSISLKKKRHFFGKFEKKQNFFATKIKMRQRMENSTIFHNVLWSFTTSVGNFYLPPPPKKKKWVKNVLKWWNFRKKNKFFFGREK